MINRTSTYGKLNYVFPIAPQYLQRAAFVAILAFAFFLAMLIAFSIRQNFGYFVLATAFLIVELFTLFGWLSQRKTQVKIFDNGFTYRNFSALWTEIESVEKIESRKIGYQIRKFDGQIIILTEIIFEVNQAAGIIEERSRKVNRGANLIK